MWEGGAGTRRPDSNRPVAEPNHSARATERHRMIFVSGLRQNATPASEFAIAATRSDAPNLVGRSPIGNRGSLLIVARTRAVIISARGFRLPHSRVHVSSSRPHRVHFPASRSLVASLRYSAACFAVGKRFFGSEISRVRHWTNSRTKPH